MAAQKVIIQPPAIINQQQPASNQASNSLSLNQNNNNNNIIIIMKVFIVLAACVVAVSAGSPRYASAPLVSSGQSTQFRSEDNYGNYNFGYDESHASGGSSRREEQVNGVRRGSYSLSDADGRSRLVNYVADADGFRATVQTNEPGVEPKDSADVIVNKAAVAVVAAPEPVYAPRVAVAAPLPAPIAAPLPAPIYSAPVAVKGYLAPRAPLVAAPVAAAPVYAAQTVVEAETPRAFSYSFGATHLAAPAYAAAPAPIAYSAPAPVYQQRLEY